MSETEAKSPFLVSLISGGIAGTSVDVALYPLDTIKTRIQSPQGFIKSGGLSGIYKGLSAAAVGSAPGAALFFSTYETMKHQMNTSFISKWLPAPLIHMVAASCGETAACLVRVPTEVVKQRMQAGMHSSITEAVVNIIKHDGGFPGMFKGFGITLMREIPFAFIQFPLYEFGKSCISHFAGGRDTHAYEGAVCGSLSGAFAAAATTPLDVLKTRLMLGVDAAGVPYTSLTDTFRRVRAEGAATSNQGLLSQYKVFFAGVQPRVMWIGIGGFVFFGAYEQAVKITTPLLCYK